MMTFLLEPVILIILIWPLVAIVFVVLAFKNRFQTKLKVWKALLIYTFTELSLIPYAVIGMMRNPLEVIFPITIWTIFYLHFIFSPKASLLLTISLGSVYFLLLILAPITSYILVSENSFIIGGGGLGVEVSQKRSVSILQGLLYYMQIMFYYLVSYFLIKTSTIVNE